MELLSLNKAHINKPLEVIPKQFFRYICLFFLQECVYFNSCGVKPSCKVQSEQGINDIKYCRPALLLADKPESKAEPAQKPLTGKFHIGGHVHCPYGKSPPYKFSFREFLAHSNTSSKKTFSFSKNLFLKNYLFMLYLIIPCPVVLINVYIT